MFGPQLFGALRATYPDNTCCIRSSRDFERPALLMFSSSRSSTGDVPPAVMPSCRVARCGSEWVS